MKVDLKNLLTEKEVLDSLKDLELIAIGDNGRIYKATYVLKHNTIFYTIPYNVKILYYVQIS